MPNLKDGKKQASISLSPEALSLFEDLRKITRYSRSELIEKAIWFAIKSGYYDHAKELRHHE